MNQKELISQIEKRFFDRLQTKTGWGKNEIILIYKNVVNEILLEVLDEPD